MATQAHCAYCFETLSAHFDNRQPLRLAEVEAFWEQYTAHHSGDKDDEEILEFDVETTGPPAKPAAISRLLNRESSRNTRSATSSSSSLPSTRSGTSSGTEGQSESSSGVTTPASSISSMFSLNRRAKQSIEKHPLFVTWNTHSQRSSGQKSLRGCIGTFEAQELERGLQTYALTSALEDIRFSPITAVELPRLSNHVTLLTDFSESTRDALDWTLGLHGIRISFLLHGRKYGATYLPDVAKEQGWTKEETVVSLMRKAGWNGSSSAWLKAWRDGKGELVRYQGKQVGMEYAEWRRFRDWIDERGAAR